MTVYEDILASLKQADREKAEFLEEEINIMIHKLKFLPKESWPSVLVLFQRDYFEDNLLSESLAEKIRIAGGQVANGTDDMPHVIIIVQDNVGLYSALPRLLEMDYIHESLAYKNNQIYIIDKADFDQAPEQYLEEAEILAEIIQPKYFYFGHEGNYWTKFEVLAE